MAGAEKEREEVRRNESRQVAELITQGLLAIAKSHFE